MAWFGRGSGSAEPTLEQLRTWHLLLVPVGVDVHAVDRLLRARVPDARIATTGRARLGRSAAVSGPHELDTEEARVVAVPDGWTTAYALEVPAERDPVAFDDIADPVLRAWWMRAFPTGKPYRDEGEAVDLAMSLARRLGGALRCAGSNVVLQPDPQRMVDLTVWSGYWLAPDVLLDLLRPLLPGAHVDLAGLPWQGPAVHSEPAWSLDPLDPLGVDLAHALGEADVEVLHSVSEAADRQALEGPDVVDGYAVTAHHDLSVEVMQEDMAPAWVRERVAHQMRQAGDPVVGYAVRWAPHDELALESEEPPYGFRMERERVRPWVRSAALAVAEATAGVVSDGAGFEVDRYLL